MDTKKQMQQTVNYILNCFKKMFRDGGNYNEMDDKKHFKRLKFYYPKDKLTIDIPVSEQEYTLWRKVKPSIRKGEAVNENRQ